MEGKSAQRFWKPSARVTQLPDFHYRSAQNLSDLFLSKRRLETRFRDQKQKRCFLPLAPVPGGGCCEFWREVFQQPDCKWAGPHRRPFLGQVIVEQVKQCNWTSSGAYPAGQCLLINVSCDMSCDHLKAVFTNSSFKVNGSALCVRKRYNTLYDFVFHSRQINVHWLNLDFSPF